MRNNAHLLLNQGFLAARPPRARFPSDGHLEISRTEISRVVRNFALFSSEIAQTPSHGYIKWTKSSKDERMDARNSFLRRGLVKSSSRLKGMSAVSHESVGNHYRSDPVRVQSTILLHPRKSGCGDFKNKIKWVFKARLKLNLTPELNPSHTKRPAVNASAHVMYLEPKWLR